MTLIAYVDGRWLPLSHATVPVEDRGLQFADAVYEVAKAVGGRLLDLDRHLDRLERSLASLRITPPRSRASMAFLMDEALRRSRLADAMVYVQVGRGVAPRNHLFPKAARASLILTVRRLPIPSLAEFKNGVAIVTRPDQRWARCEIKSVGLLPNVLAKQDAAQAGAREAWLVDGDGQVTEGSSTNAWIVDANGRIVTHPLSPRILGGVTRSVVLDLAQLLQIPVDERVFTAQEAASAAEAFLTSTTSFVLPVTRIDGVAIGRGTPGPVTCRLLDAYIRHCGATIHPKLAPLLLLAP